MNINLNANKLLLNMNSYKMQSSLHTQRLSTGLKINSAADDPSQILRINRLNSKIRGYDAATQNVQDGVSLIQQAQDSLSVINNMGQRLKELSVQYNNETVSPKDKASIEKESVALLKEMNNIKDNTEFNGQKVFSKTDYNIQIGDESGDKYTITIKGFQGISNSDLDKGLLSVATGETSTTSTSGTTTSPGQNTTGGNTSTTSTTTASSGIKPDPILAPTFGVSIPNTSESTNIQLHDKNGTLIYDGTILNGKFDGYGTLYDSNGKKTYQGNFTNGSYNGYGIQYASDGHTVYQGETSFGTINNYGTQYANDGSILYQGTTVYGVKDGYGNETLSNGYKYSGYYTNGLRSGLGTMTDNNGSSLYSGNWTQDKPADGTVISGYTPKTPSEVSTPNDPQNTDDPTNNGSTTGELFSTLFSNDFIDKYIIKPISEAMSDLGIQEKVLNYHSDWLQSQNDLNEDSLSKIQDADMAKELMEKSKADLLQQTNISLFTQALDFNKNNILALLS